MKKIKVNKLLSLLLCICMVASFIPPVKAVEPLTVSEDMRIATLSDIRYYPSSLAGDRGDAYYTYTEGAGVISDDQNSILDAAFAGLSYEAEHNGLKYAVICGDITLGGEYAAAREFAIKLKKFSNESGIKVFVTNGDRDINNPGASEFTENVRKNADNISQAEFVELFADFGYGDAYHTYKMLGCGTQGALTYSVKTDDGYRFIFADCGRYTVDCTDDHTDKCEKAGAFSDEQFAWILNEAADAKAAGETPLLFSHWNMTAMNDAHEYLFGDHVVANSYKVSDMLADAGIVCSFSGSVNVSDVSLVHSDSGAPLYSVISPSVTQYPFAYRITDFDFGTDGTAYIGFEQHECDEMIDVVSPAGVSYPSPYRLIGFGKQFGHNADPVEYLNTQVKGALSELVRDITAEGSIVSYVEKKTGVNVSDAVNSFIGKGLKLGSTVLLSPANVMSFIADLDKQLMNAYVYKPGALYALAEKAVKNIADIKVSEVPCTKYLAEYGFGSATNGGTLGELILDMLAGIKRGNEKFTDDAFVKDFLNICRQPEFINLMIESFEQYVIKDIIVDKVLADTEFRISSFFVDHALSVSGYFQILVSVVIVVFASDMLSSGGDRESWASFAQILTGSSTISVETAVNVILGIGSDKPGVDVYELVDRLVKTVFGDEQKEAMAYQLGVLMDGLCNDNMSDYGDTFFYSGNEVLSDDEKDMRIPSMVQISVNSNNSFTVTWYTKYSVTGTDIEIVKDGGTFTGIPTKADFIAVDTSKETFNGYGFDCGTFGFMLYEKEVVKHIITVRNLVTDSKFKFRIGDAEKNFWKECSFTTGSTSEKPFTFLNFNDTDGLTADSYDTLNTTINAVSEEFDNIAFAVHSGNIVRNPKNDVTWKWALDKNDDIFTNVPLMYASGSNDANRLHSVKKHFTYSRTPLQYDEDGTYYSFDYGNAHFSVINMNALNANGSLSEGQAKWLEADLAASKAAWKILVFHSPVIGVADVKPILLSQLLEQISKYKVDFVIQGGSGAYVRSDLLVNGTATGAYDIKDVAYGGRIYPVYEENGGFVAMSCGSCGGKTGEPLPETPLLVANEVYDLPVCSAITVNGDTLCVAVFTVAPDGTLTQIDSYGLRKESVSYLLGDTDMDGEITPSDARLALRISVGLNKVTPITKAAADIDGDIRVMPSDARLILRMAVGLERNDIHVRKFIYEIAAYANA